MSKQPEQEQGPDKLIVSVQTLAAALNLTERRIQQLAKDGFFETEGGKRGRYDMVKCVRGYMRFLADSYKRPENVASIADETLRGKRIDNDERQINLAERVGELAPVELLSGILDSLITNVKAVVTAKGNALQTAIAKDPTKAVKKTDDCIREILHELAGLSGDTLITQAQAETIQPAGKNNRKPMGGQVQETKP